MFPIYPINDRASVEAIQAAPAAMKQIAEAAIDAFARAVKNLRFDIVAATLRTMFS